MNDPPRRVWTARLLDVLDHVGLDELAAVGEEGVETGLLEGGDEQVLLANRKLHGIAGLPEAVDLPVRRVGLTGVRRVPPLRGGQQPGVLRPYVHACEA